MSLLGSLFGSDPAKKKKEKEDYERGFDDGLWMRRPSREDRKNKEYMKGHFDGFDEGLEEDEDFL